MKTVALADNMIDSLKLVPGKDIQENLSRLLGNSLVLQLRDGILPVQKSELTNAYRCGFLH
ncbi:MAG: hypothetical protein V2B19_24040 [Pseudomonadota bacterium]